MNPRNTDNQAREGGVGRAPFGDPGSANPGDGAIVALFRIGTRRAWLAAALMVVVTGLVIQTATQALAQARETVLYLDAPAVSIDRATRAGEVARAYSGPRSSAYPDALAWLGVGPSQGDDTEASPPDAESAFASITAPDADGTPTITAEAAYEAGETMLAQIEDGVPSGDGSPSESDLAAAGGAVRPELGYGTQAPEEEPSETHEAPPAEQLESPDLASSPAPVESTAAPAIEPSGSEGLSLETPAPTSDAGEAELAAVPFEDAYLAPETSLGTEPEYGATGPVSEPAPEWSIEPSGGPGVQEPEVQKSEPKDEEVREPHHESGELAGAEPAPASFASRAPVDERAYEGDEAAYAEPATEEPTYDHSAAPPATGPTNAKSDDAAFVAPSSPPPADDGVTDDGGVDELASASPAPEEGSGQDNAPGQGLPEGQVTAVVIVQGSEAGEGSDPSAAPEGSAPPDGEPVPTSLADAPQEESAPETQTEAQPDTDASPPPADQGTGAESASADDASAPERATLNQELDASDDPDSHDGLDDPGAEGGSDTASPSPTSEPGEDAGGAASEHTDEAPAACSRDSQGATPTDEPAPEDDTSAHDSASPAEAGGQAGPQDTAEQSPAPGDGSSANPTTEPQAEDRSLQDQDEEPSVGSQPTNYSIRTVEPADTDPRSSGEDPADSTGRRTDEDHSPSTGRQPDTGPAASQPASEPRPTPEPASERYSAAPEDRDAHKNGGARRTPSVWVRRGVPGGRSGIRPSGHANGQRDGAQEAAADPRAQARAEATADRLARRQEAKRAERREARQEKIAYRQRVAAEGAAAARRTDRRAERRGVRRADIFAAGVAERQAERRANRIATRRAERRAAAEQVAIERSAIERAAIRDQRRQNRLAAGRRNAPVGAPARGEPVAQPAAVERAPVRQVRAQRFTPAEQPPASQLPPARHIPPARLDPAPQVRPQLQPEVQAQPQQRVASGGVRMPKSVDRATGR